MTDCKLKELIYANRKSGEYVVPHTHDTYEVVYFMGGEGVASIGDQNYHYNGDTIQIIAPNTLHKDISYITTKVRCCVFYCFGNISFSNSTILKDEHNKKYFDNILSQIKILEEILSKSQNNKLIDSNSGILYSDYETETKIDQELWFLILNLLNIVNNYNNKKPLKNDFIDEIKHYIEKNFNKNISFEILAAKVGYSYDRLRHIFVEKTGLSLKKYQQSIRLAKAKIFLTETNYKVKQIAQKCGFASDVRFSIFFQNSVGITPLKYRRIMKDVLNQPAP